MADYARDSLHLDDEDRLPWLEPAMDTSEGQGVSPLKLLGLILIGLAVVGALVAGIYWLNNRAGIGGGEGTLIAAPPGDYKVPAKEADAKKFAGEGDASFAASEGVERDGRIDPSRVPEAPVTGGPAPVQADRGAAIAKPATRVTAPVADATRAKAPKQAATPAGAAGGKIQIGAYGSQAMARDAWSRMSKRFPYLEPLGTSIEEAEVGGTKLYRLRAFAGSLAQAQALCGRLKVAGESCMVGN